MKLYLVHCGFYDRALAHGIYESHVNLFVVGSDFEDAKRRAKALPEFKERKMHVDGVVAVEAVDGYRVALEEDAALAGKTLVARSGQAWDELNA